MLSTEMGDGMGWFKRSKPALDEKQIEEAHELVNSAALAVAIAESVRDYTDALARGRLTFPAHRREGAGVIEIWEGVRLEALHRLFNYGQSDAFLLATHDKQAALVDCFLNDRPHLEMPQPRGEPMADTIQALFQCYVYLDAVGSEVCDRETDRMTLQLEGRSLTSEIEAKAAALQPPETLLDALFEDITRKSKSIALSAKFGPDYEGGMRWVRGKLEESGSDTTSYDAVVQKVLAAESPDDVSGGSPRQGSNK